MPNAMRRSGILNRLSLLAMTVTLCAFSLLADDQPKKEKPDEPVVPLFNEYWAERGVVAMLGAGGPLQQAAFLPVAERLSLWEIQVPVLRGEARTPVGAAVVLLGGGSAHGPLSTPILLQSGDFLDCWSLEDFERVRRLDPFLLRALRDDEPLPDPDTRTPAAVDERFLLNDALSKSLRSGEAAFERVARSNLAVEDLTKKPAAYRGEVVRLHTRLRRIRELEAPPALKQFGARHFYEVWALARSEGVEKQVCLLTPVLPPGLKPTEDAPAGQDVALSGYFFKRFRFGPDGGVPGQPERSVPLLVGRATPIIGQEVRAVVGAGAVIGAGVGSCAPLGQTLTLRAGERALAWTIEDRTRVRPLDRGHLGIVRDRTPLPSEYPETERETMELFAYYEAMINSHRTPAQVFLQSARPNITFVQLFNEPGNYRGEVVRLEGRLRRIWEHKPKKVEADAGIKAVYEAWLYNSKYGDPNPVMLLCTSLPKGIEVNEDVQGDVEVAFVGYFFKQYRYTARDTRKPNEFRVAPLLIGHVVPLKSKPAREESGWASGLMPLFLTVLAVTIVIIVGLTWAFRRADHSVLSRLNTGTPPLEDFPPQREGAVEREPDRSDLDPRNEKNAKDGDENFT